MTKALSKKASKIQIIISAIGLILLFLIVGYFILTKYLLNSFESEDYCSNKGVEMSKAGQPWGPNEVEKCMDDYKRTY